MNIEQKEYHRLARHLPAKPAQDIPFCSIFPFFQYSLIHDLAHSANVKTKYRYVVANSARISENKSAVRTLLIFALMRDDLDKNND